MARRGTVLALEPVVAELAATVEVDEVTTRVLDATAALLGELGIGRWSIDDVAERSGLGRTTVYRRFDGRDQLVHAVLAREARAFFAAIGSAVAHLPSVEDQVIDGMLVGLRSVRASVLARLLERDPGAVLPLLTTAAAPLLVAARRALVEIHRAAGRAEPADAEAELVADALVRLGLSLVLTPSDLLDLDDDAAARVSLGRWIGPLLRS